eukprot:TRINITY_DN22851_c0_g1_i1.p1 TRINITY_DN22851_c0_g1~~TRINITY_DN22851_c0_g1_i1.p1  ORF type:complete len:281 (+),score=57.05 TRINITY_DN22851_c0_g1_i1:129-971(+)
MALLIQLPISVESVGMGVRGRLVCAEKKEVRSYKGLPCDGHVLPGCLRGRVASTSLQMKRRLSHFEGRGDRRGHSVAKASGGVSVGEEESGNGQLMQMLEGVAVQDTGAQAVPILELWADRKVVVAWARHFGCILCRRLAANLAAHKVQMDAAGVSLILIGAGNAEQARMFQEQTSFPGEVYGDPSFASYKALGFISGLSTILTPKAGLNLLSALGDGYRQDWTTSLQPDTVQHGAWWQGGLIVAGPGTHNLRFLHKDAEAGDEPNMEDVLSACCKDATR